MVRRRAERVWREGEVWKVKLWRALLAWVPRAKKSGWPLVVLRVSARRELFEVVNFGWMGGCQVEVLLRARVPMRSCSSAAASWL